MSRILLLEDDLSLVTGLSFALKKQGFALNTARTLREADAAWADGSYDLLVLDVSLPDGSGFAFCEKVRRTSNVPIMFLTASDEETNIIMGLDMGGDDYITKPFKLGVLLSRINALLRRANAFCAEDTELQSNGIRVLLLQGQAFKNGELLALTAAEYKLLCLFLRNPNRVLTKEQILDKLWEKEFLKNTISDISHQLKTPLAALNWCKTAIPIGCALGTVTCWVLCLILRFVVKGEWVDMPLFAVSASGILSGAVVGVVTVFIAAHSPARQAARVSPAAAVSGNADASSHYAAHAAKPGLLKVETSLGIHHAMGAGKNLFLMTGSFALMIVLFLAFSVCLDIVHKLLPSVNSHLTPDFSIYSVDDTNSLDPAMADEIAALPGVKCTYGTMSRTAQPARINGAETTIDLYSYGDAMLDDAKRSVASGDLSKVYGDSGYALAIFSDATRLNVGDSVTVNGQTLEIACVLSEGIGSISGAPVIVCSGETFTRLTGETHYMLLNVLAEKDISDAAVQKLYALAGDAAVSDNRELQSEVNGSYWVFRLAVYGFLAIISLITVLNIVNSISMGVSARTRQYGAMRAVGMEGRQITRMIAAEAVTYAACGTVTGLVLGLALHRLIYAKIVITHFGGVWKVPVESIALVVLLVAASCVLAVHGPARRIRNMPITATINEL